MPRTRPTLLSVEFSAAASSGEREVHAVWTGTPEQPYPQRLYLGTLRCTGEVAITDEYSAEAMYKWRLYTIPVDATFLVPTKEPMDSRPVAAARWMLRAAYRAAGYGLFNPGGE